MVDKYGMTYKLENVLKTWKGVGCPNMFRFGAPSWNLEIEHAAYHSETCMLELGLNARSLAHSLRF